MRRFGWVLNLDAELELAHPAYTPPRRLQEQLATHGTAARALLGPRDVLIGATAMPALARSPLRPNEAADLIGRAWCPTPLAIASLRSAGVEPEPHPAADVLRRVNHRRFAFELGGGLPGQMYVEERAAIDALTRSAEHPWLLKRPLAFAGRGQLRIHSNIDVKQSYWIDASLRRDGLVVEPLVFPILEVSVHGFVWPRGQHELGRVCVQEVTDRGVFRSIRLARAGELATGETTALLERAAHVASALAAAGYFGPFGIDAFRYRAGHGESFCALSEINARYSMGFATGFPRHPSDLGLGD